MIKVILGTFFIDLMFFLLISVVLFFCYAVLKTFRDKSDEKIDKMGPHILGILFDTFKKYIPVLIKWFVIIFIIHSICRLYDYFVNFVQENVTYDSVPFLALLFDLLKSFFSYVGPIIVPVIIVLFSIVILYGIFATMYQYSARADFQRDIINSVGSNNSTAVSLYHTNGSLAEDYDDTDNEIESEKKSLEKQQTSLPASANNKKHHKRRLPKGWFFNFCNNSFIGFGKIAKFLPKIFLVVVICVGANALFLNVKNVVGIVNNQKRINELNMTVKNLSRAEAVAEICLVDEMTPPGAPYPIKTYRICVLDEDGEPIKNQTQKFTLEGNQLAIDTMNINFDYSEIAKGEHYNIAYPYRIHSDVVTSEKGIPFKCFSEDGKSYPVMYGLENSVVYSMDRNTYYQNLSELFDIAKDEARAAEFGIRSFVGQDIHEPIYKGETYRLIVTGTGGVKLSKVQHLDVDDSEEDFSDKEIQDMYKINKDKM